MSEHASDCAVHDAPALPVGPCDCGAAPAQPRPPGVPSWMRWPPNCCETCKHWQAEQTRIGRCENQQSTHAGDQTDSRSRCQDFYRGEGK